MTVWFLMLFGMAALESDGYIPGLSNLAGGSPVAYATEAECQAVARDRVQVFRLYAAARRPKKPVAAICVPGVVHPVDAKLK